MTNKEWDGRYGERNREVLEDFLFNEADSFVILQLKDTEENTAYRFMNYSWVKKQGEEPDADRYAAIYTGDYAPGTTLEDIYVRFNTNIPDGFTGHSLSVSDIIGVKKAGVRKYYYVDSIGFKELS